MNATTRRLGARLVLVLGLCLALEGVGMAAKRPRCAGLQRRAQSKLENALAACAEKQGSADVAGCSTERWRLYTRQLRRARCPLPDGRDSTPTVGNPLFSKVRSELASADDLAAADVESRDAQLALRAVLRRLVAEAERVRRGANPASSLVHFAADLTAAVERVADAEQQLSDVEAAVWGGLRGDALLPWLVDEPIRVAMEQVQIEVRRLLGPDFRTEITALRDDPACAGDVVGDRLIAAYGRAVLTPGDDRKPEVAALGRVAAQLACLSFRQASLLDVSLGVAYDLVTTRLERAGLARLEDGFARFFAPLEVLVFDTVKLAGDHAHAWYWFVDHRVALKDEVSRVGWATRDVVWLYDRVDGKLVGFPECAGDDFERCVNVPAFLDSLADPRAIGLGDCALAGMVTGGLKQAGGASLYACPSGSCDAGGSTTPATGSGSRFPGAPGFGSGGLGSGGLGSGGASGTGGTGSSTGGALPWSGLTSADRGVIDALGCGGVGGGGGGGSGSGDGEGTQGRGGHGGAGGEEDCFEQAIHAPRDPYGAYVQCVDAASGGHGLPGATVDLAGVPMGPDCGPGVADQPGGGTSGGGSGGKTSTTTQPSSSSTTTVEASDTTSTTAAQSAKPPCVPTGLLDAIGKVSDCGLKVLAMALSPEKPKAATKAATGVAAAAGEVVGVEIALSDPQVMQDTMGMIEGKVRTTIETECNGDGSLSAGECATLRKMKPGDAAEYLHQKHLMDCAPDTECDAVCTSLDQQVMERFQDCQRELTDALVTDPAREHASDPRVNPDPNGDTGGLPDDPLTSCLLADPSGASGGTNYACGLVLCTDGAATAHAASACCGQASPAIGVSIERALLEHTCEQVHCADDQSAVGDGLGACGCGGAGGATGGGTASPSPRPGPPQR